MFLFSLLLLCPIVLSEVTGPLTDDFQTWLQQNNYVQDDFPRENYGKLGSYGGKTSDAPKSTHTPVVFIHGNSDTALETSSQSTGWTNTIEFFLKNGYTTADLYATSWGDNNALNAASRTHNCQTLLRLRRFVEAVLKYTGSKKISLITHSMGVTLGRKIIKGGKVVGPDGDCDIGKSLNQFVDVFVGLSGGNYGLCDCEASGVVEPTCNKQNGLWPGDSCGFNFLTCGLEFLPYPCTTVTYSQFLMDLNGDNTREGDFVYSAWSAVDNLILYGDWVWGRPTSLIPRSNGKKIYATYTHMQTKELTAEDQYKMVVNKTI